ncbi:MAG: Sir2 family NAD-dependent protein deacetylase, partial [Sulfolobus sp.]
GLIKAVITQNIDGLHQMAGSKNVIELHGTMRRCYCTNCFNEYKSEEILERIDKGENPPKCSCGGIIRPDVVLFGEPVYRIHEALEIARESDLVLVVGSSLSVYPANLIPLTVKEYGGRVIIINAEETEMDHIADLIIRDKAEIVLPCVVEEIENQTLHRSS